MEVDLIYDTAKDQRKVKRILQIDRENIELVKRLNRIIRSKPTVDCWNTNINIAIDNKSECKHIKNFRIIKENKELYQKLQEIYDRKLSNSEHEKNKKFKKIDNKKLLIKNLHVNNRPRCYFDLQVVETQQLLGRIVMEVYVDIVPKTCKNFISFCMGKGGLSYRNTPFHRIIQGYLCQGGDVTHLNGTGGTSVYGEYFEDENFILKHTEPGILSMCNTGNNTNNSKFNLTFKKLEILDGKNVVFGRVIYGLTNLHKVEIFGTKTGKPKNRIIITKCGLC